ncbi:hypothetical protein CCP4SC76_740006 [Gammaproteobacteria bacterium]
MAYFTPKKLQPLILFRSLWYGLTSNFGQHRKNLGEWHTKPEQNATGDETRSTNTTETMNNDSGTAPKTSHKAINQRCCFWY